MTQARFELDEYTTRVLDIVKGKYGLKNREAALNHFIKTHGENYLEYTPNERYLEKLDKIVEEHEAKYSKRTMTIEELDKLLDL